MKEKIYKKVNYFFKVHERLKLPRIEMSTTKANITGLQFARLEKIIEQPNKNTLEFYINAPF